MTDDKLRTERGFRVFGSRTRLPDEITFGKSGDVKVFESSLAMLGPHVWIKDPVYQGVELNLEEAKLVIKALKQFIKEAEADLLTEPVRTDD